MIGILYHPMIARSRPMAESVAAWLQTQGQSAWVGSVKDDDAVRTQMPDLSMAVALGGDGSILRAARLASPFRVPVFSINLGKLGFLSEASPDDWQQRLQCVFKDAYRLEQRLMLSASVLRNGKPLTTMQALNEVVVSRGGQARVVRFDLYVDENRVTSYVADGLIATTPTGSTAYALAAGGPIMPPELPNYAIVPVAPHLSLERPLVLYEKATTRIVVEFDHEANVTADGQESLALESGDEVVITKAPDTSLFVRVEDPSYFYRRLMAREDGFKPLSHR